MQTRRLAGVAVLAAAVLVLSVGTALSRPQVVGTAGAPPIDPPPQVGECLYAGPDGPWGTADADGEYRDNPYAHWFSACRDPWYAEVVAIRTREDITAGLSTAGTYGPGAGDPCAAGTAAFLGRPQYLDPTGLWIAGGPGSGTMMPNRRQYAAGQMWEACLLGPPSWTADGTAVAYGPGEPDPTTTRSLRGAWADATFRNRVGSCGDSHRGPVMTVFCGSPHGTEAMAWTYWPTDTVPIGGASADALVATCSALAARMMERSDPTAGGALAVEVWMDDLGGYVAVTPGTDVPDTGNAECALSPTSLDRQLTATLVGIGEGPVPLTPG